MTGRLSGPTSPDARFSQVSENIKRVRDAAYEAAVRSGRRPEEITILAVTKTVPAPLINHAIACGITHIGENRVQEYLSKREELRLGGVEVHLIGMLQSNKVRKIVGLVDMIQSVESISLAREISRISVERSLVTDCLIEVNIGREASKSGVNPDALDELAFQMAELPGVRVRGLMAIPPIEEEMARTREHFSKMTKLFLDMRGKKMDNMPMDCLSMGMSSDYTEAILAGATLIRPGSALFGARNI